jgi:glycosyltransferase involved in cell wall biosynthesis
MEVSKLKLSIIMPFLNEESEPIQTIRSLYSTAAKKDFEIIVIDDNSIKSPDFKIFKDFKNVKYIRNKTRLGVDGCRQLGANLAITPNLFIIDAHMRFNKNWNEQIINLIEKEPNTFWCTTCVQLGYGNMDLSKSDIKYYGAKLVFINGTVNGRPAREILEPKWLEKKQDGEYEIPCLLGANYFFKKERFNYIHGLNGLKMWGTSEPFLSLKNWLAGGKNKITTNIEIGHKFRDNAPYSTPVWSMVYNKIFLCKTIFPSEFGNSLIDQFQKNNTFNEAMTEIKRNESFIDSEAQYYKKTFTRKIGDFCKYFEGLQ